jgi:hypothetical protein
MEAHREWLWFLGVIGLVGSSVVAIADQVPIKLEAQTAHYRLELLIGPTEKMYSPADVAVQHPTMGEVMVGGVMSMTGMSMDMGDTRHLEVHVHSLDKGAVLTDANVAIVVTAANSKKAADVPIAKMYGIKDGPSDTHYGNNLSMPPGDYSIEVTVNGEKANFKFTIPAS